MRMNYDLLIYLIDNNLRSTIMEYLDEGKFDVEDYAEFMAKVCEYTYLVKYNPKYFEYVNKEYLPLLKQNVIKILIEKYIFRHNFDIVAAKKIIQDYHYLDQIDWESTASRISRTSSKTDSLVKYIFDMESKFSKKNTEILFRMASHDCNETIQSLYATLSPWEEAIVSQNRLVARELENANVDKLRAMARTMPELADIIRTKRVRDIAIQAAFNRDNGEIMKFLLSLGMRDIIDLDSKEVFELFVKSNVESYEIMMIHGFDIQSYLAAIITGQSYPVTRLHTANYYSERRANEATKPKSDELLAFILKNELEFPPLTEELLFRLTQFVDTNLLQYYFDHFDLGIAESCIKQVILKLSSRS